MVSPYKTLDNFTNSFYRYAVRKGTLHIKNLSSMILSPLSASHGWRET